MNNFTLLCRLHYISKLIAIIKLCQFNIPVHLVSSLANVRDKLVYEDPGVPEQWQWSGSVYRLVLTQGPGPVCTQDHSSDFVRPSR